jgi:hypothetical protein
MPTILWKSVHDAPFPLDWWTLPWPWSQLVLELRPTVLLALAALPALAAAMVINRTFRWVSLFRTGMINLTLIILGHYLLEYLHPWLSRPVPGYLYQNKSSLVIPPVFQVLISFSNFLVSAWLGCGSPRRASSTARPA